MILIVSLAVLSGAVGIAHAQTTEPLSAPESTPNSATPTSETPVPIATSVLDEVITTRTPEPTATPGRVEQQVTELTARVGLAYTRFLGLRVTDWINLGISLLIVVVAYLLGSLLIRRVLPKLVQRTESTFDDRLLKTAGPDLRWLVVIFLLDYATKRLTFVDATLKTILSDLYFVVSLAIAVRVVWHLLDLADTWYHERAASENREEQLGPIITLLVRLGRIVAGLVGIIILLSRFGVNVTAFAAVLGLGGLAFSLAARDTIADAIAGFIILVDRPFRIGDRIEIENIGTWGDVVDIGLRTTRIRTRDNRMVIVPNSVIGTNQVINYTYPDPRYRIQTHVGLAYGTDVTQATQVLIDAVRQVEGVLEDKPVDALYIEMGDSAMIFRIRWWIESYIDTRRMFDRVHRAIQRALDEAGIESPYPTQTLNLRGVPIPAEESNRGVDQPRDASPETR